MAVFQKNLRLAVDPTAHQRLGEEARQSLAEGRERCGFLLGAKDGQEIRIFSITSPGPQATLQAGHCEPDYRHAAIAVADLKERYRDIALVGGWHTHLGYGDQLSGGDRETLRRTSLRQPGFVALLINIRRDGQMSLNPYVLRNGQLAQCDYKMTKVEPEPLPEHEQRIRGEIRSEKFTRTRELLPTATLAKKRVLLIGQGSGGSTVAIYLARTGLYYFTLVDHETLQEVNLVRHIGLPCDVGRLKVEIVREAIEAISPLARVEALDFDVTTDQIQLRRLIATHDLVLACTGNPQINQLTNQLALEERKPAVYAGVFPQGVCGYVLQVIPEQTACFNCLFSISKESYPTDSDELLGKIGQQYGFDEADLHAQQGLYVDISFVTLLLAKAALITLLRGSQHQAGSWPGNLILWNARSLVLHRGHLSRREDCWACNPEGWLKKKEKQLSDSTPKTTVCQPDGQVVPTPLSVAVDAAPANETESTEATRWWERMMRFGRFSILLRNIYRRFSSHS